MLSWTSLNFLKDCLGFQGQHEERGIDYSVMQKVNSHSSLSTDTVPGWVAQRGSGGPIPGNIQGQVGQGSDQPDLVKDVPAHCMEVGLDDL